MTLDIEKYRTAAVLMCERLGVDPHDHAAPQDMQPWAYYARRMAEHCLMVETLRECGRYPDKKE